ncbi:DNA-3-methyladenine glycosylase 2 family protein [Streptomyces sp. LHD-70]|uniref:DNA-3-methyladenine glycosylase family protein n=1 Tax=Streptomyces sp. LHD-70 TaxID=3072140 RepID=UPI00280E7950|nr:DNA-3-methyladenine glycosylase 2 family protein [Streptomyces sp. LHD-70]MDQ8705971.1 DNA-3-methyladenine glycosylase 2 family protein [Streptomyces sp. LHD-70]
MATPLRIRPQGPFSLAAAIRFQQGFAPADYKNNGGAAPKAAPACSTAVTGSGPQDFESLRFAFALDDEWTPAGALVHPDPEATDGRVLVEPYGEGDPEAVRKQAARILSLDVDGSSFPAVGERDEIVGRLQGLYPGLRPVCFNSPYEAAAWAVIGHRIRIVQAASIRTRIARKYGTPVDVGGLEVPAFPSPQTLLALPEVPGLPSVKSERLHAVSRAALDGELDPAVLRSLDPGDALQRLCKISGIGPFSAELILIRGAGHPDHFASQERRLHASMSEAYGVDATDTAALHRIASAWSPYRSWVALLFRTDRENTTHEISRGRQAPSASAHQPDGQRTVRTAVPTQLRIG